MTSSKLTYEIVSKWSQDDVVDWVEEIGVHEASSFVISNDIDGKALLKLDESTIKANIVKLNEKKLSILLKGISEFQKMPPPLQPRSRQNDDEDDNEFDDSFEDEDAVYDNGPNAVVPPPRTGRAPLPVPANQSAPPLPPYSKPLSTEDDDEDDDEYEQPDEKKPTSPGRPPCKNPPRAPPAITGRAQPSTGSRQPPVPPTPPPTNNLYEANMSEQKIPPQAGRNPPNPKSQLSAPQLPASTKPIASRQVLPPTPIPDDDDEMYMEPDDKDRTIARSGRGPVPVPSGKALPPPPPEENDELYEETDDNKFPPKSTAPPPRVNPPLPSGGKGRPMPPPPEDEEFYEDMEQHQNHTPAKPVGGRLNPPAGVGGGRSMPPPLPEDGEEVYEDLESENTTKNTKVYPISRSPLPPPPAPSDAADDEDEYEEFTNEIVPEKTTGRSRPTPPVRAGSETTQPAAGKGRPPVMPPVPAAEYDEEYQEADNFAPLPKTTNNQPTPPSRGKPPPPAENDEMYEESFDESPPRQKISQTSVASSRAPVLPQRGIPQPPAEDEDLYEDSDDFPQKPQLPGQRDPPPKPPSIPGAVVGVPFERGARVVSPKAPIGPVFDLSIISGQLNKLRPVSPGIKQTNPPPKKDLENTGTGNKFGPVVHKKIPPKQPPVKKSLDENSNQIEANVVTTDSHPPVVVATESHPPGGPKPTRPLPKTYDKAPPGAPPNVSPSVRQGPLPELPPVKELPVDNDISTNPWFFGNLGRIDANNKVKALGSEGSFLIRLSQQGGQPYTLCVFFNGETLNIQIRKRPDGKFALGSQKPDENVFDTVAEMIKFHRNNSIEVTKSDGSRGKVKLLKNPTK